MTILCVKYSTKNAALRRNVMYHSVTSRFLSASWQILNSFKLQSTFQSDIFLIFLFTSLLFWTTICKFWKEQHVHYQKISPLKSYQFVQISSIWIIQLFAYQDCMTLVFSFNSRVIQKATKWKCIWCTMMYLVYNAIHLRLLF